MKYIKRIFEFVYKLLEIDIVRIVFFSIITILCMAAFVNNIIS